MFQVSDSEYLAQSVKLDMASIPSTTSSNSYNSITSENSFNYSTSGNSYNSINAINSFSACNASADYRLNQLDSDTISVPISCPSATVGVFDLGLVSDDMPMQPFGSFAGFSVEGSPEMFVNISTPQEPPLETISVCDVPKQEIENPTKKRRQVKRGAVKSAVKTSGKRKKIVQKRGG